MVVMMRRHDDHGVMVVVMMMVVVVVVISDHYASHDARSPDDGPRRGVNRSVRRNPRHDVVRPDNRHDVVVVMMVMMMRSHHHDHVVMVVMVMVMVDIWWRRGVVLRLDQLAAGRFLRVGEPQPRRGVRDRLEQFCEGLRRRDGALDRRRTGAAGRQHRERGYDAHEAKACFVHTIAPSGRP
jgi:hypothetical protein